MITRKKFWMRKETLTTQVKEKTAGRIDVQGLLGTLEDSWAVFRGACGASQMNVENDRIVVKYKIVTYGYILG